MDHAMEEIMQRYDRKYRNAFLALGLFGLLSTSAYAAYRWAHPQPAHDKAYFLTLGANIVAATACMGRAAHVLKRRDEELEKRLD